MLPKERKTPNPSIVIMLVTRKLNIFYSERASGRGLIGILTKIVNSNNTIISIIRKIVPKEVRASIVE